MTRQRKFWYAAVVLAFASFICGIQNEESSLWWIPCIVLGLGAAYCIKQVASGGGDGQ